MLRLLLCPLVAASLLCGTLAIAGFTHDLGTHQIAVLMLAAISAIMMGVFLFRFGVTRPIPIAGPAASFLFMWSVALLIGGKAPLAMLVFLSGIVISVHIVKGFRQDLDMDDVEMDAHPLTRESAMVLSLSAPAVSLIVIWFTQKAWLGFPIAIAVVAAALLAQWGPSLVSSMRLTRRPSRIA